jgi:hypothetical protein
MDVDVVVEGAIDTFHRLTRIPVKQLEWNELHFIDADLASLLESKLIHLVDNADNKDEIVRYASHDSKYAKLIGEFISHWATKGERLPVKRLSILSVKDASSKYSTLTPYIMTSMIPDKAYLVGYGNGVSNVWFSATNEASTNFTCIGYNGKPIKVAFEKMQSLGYERINVVQNQLKLMCKAELKGEFGVSDIKNVGLFIGKKTIAGFDHDDAMRKLNNLLESMPENKPENKPARTTQKNII